MEKDFDLNAIGKQIPYRVPEGFFERMQGEVLERTVVERRRKRLYRWRVGITAVLGAAAIWCGVMFFLPSTPVDNVQAGETNTLLAAVDDPMEVYLQQLSDEELEEWIEFSENDIFYELTNETENYEED